VSVTSPLPEHLVDERCQSDVAYNNVAVVHATRPFLADPLGRRNFGVGTFALAAGGMVILGGACFRLGSDAGMGLPGALDRVRSAAVAAVGQVAPTRIGEVATVRELLNRIDSVIEDAAGVVAVELSGTIDRVGASKIATSVLDGPANAAFGRTECTFAGFRVRPSNSVAACYRLQFLNRDRTFGARLVDVSVVDAQLRVSLCAEVHRVVEVRPGPRSPEDGETRRC
jgi:acetolactate decarboxylase